MFRRFGTSSRPQGSRVSPGANGDDFKVNGEDGDAELECSPFLLQTAVLVMSVLYFVITAVYVNADPFISATSAGIPVMSFTSSKATFFSGNFTTLTTYVTPAVASTLKSELRKYLYAIGFTPAIVYICMFLALMFSDRVKDEILLIIKSAMWIINAVQWPLIAQVFLYHFGNKTNEAAYGVAVGMVGFASCVYLVELLRDFVSIKSIDENDHREVGASRPLHLQLFLFVFGLAVPATLLLVTYFGMLLLPYEETAKDANFPNFLRAGFPIFSVVLFGNALYLIWNLFAIWTESNSADGSRCGMIDGKVLAVTIHVVTAALVLSIIGLACIDLKNKFGL